MKKSITVRAMKAALLADQPTPRQWTMLRWHRAFALAGLGLSMRKLTILGGYDGRGAGYGTANLHYGKLGGKVAVKLGFKSGRVDPRLDKTASLATYFRGDHDEKDERLWYMNEVTVKALTQIFE